MMAKKIENRINELCTHFLFDYQGKECGVDPLSRTNFDMWYGDSNMTAISIDEVMKIPFFDGRSLTDIADEIENIEW